MSHALSDNFYYLFERSVEDRLNGVVSRLNAHSLQPSENGSKDLGYSLVGNRIEHRFVLSRDFDGEFSPIELPEEASHLPSGFFDLVRLNTCEQNNRIMGYAETETSLITYFYDVNGRFAAEVRADSTSC